MQVAQTRAEGYEGADKLGVDLGYRVTKGVGTKVDSVWYSWVWKTDLEKKAFSHSEFFGLLSSKGAAAAINQCYVAAAIPQWPLAASRCRSRSRQPGVKILEAVPGSALQKPPTWKNVVHLAAKKSRFPTPLPRSVPKQGRCPWRFWIFMPRWWGLHIQQGGHWSCVASYSHEEWVKAGLLIGGKTHRCFLEVWCAALRNYVKWPAGMMIQHGNLTSCCIVGTKGQPHQVILKRE